MTGPTIAEILDIYIKDRTPVVAEPKTLRAVVKPLIRILGDQPAAAVDQDMIDRYIAARAAEGGSPGTIRRDLSALLAARRLAHRQRLLPPPDQVSIPRAGPGRQRVLTQGEVGQLLTAAVDSRCRLLILIGLSTGARLTAISELTWDRVDLDRRVIDFRAPHPRANRRKGRSVAPISEQLAATLAALRPSTGQGRVFNVGPHGLRAQFIKARDSAGLGSDVTPHVMRHTAATVMVRSAPLIQASKMLGHSSTKITESVYVHLMADDLRGAAEAAAAMLPNPTPQGPGPLSRLWSGLRGLFTKKPKPTRRKPSGRRRSHKKGAKRT